MKEFKSHQPLEKAKHKLIRKWINEWLEEGTVYCNSCGATYNALNTIACCEAPQIGKNIDHMLAVLITNQKRRGIRIDRFGSNTEGTGRIAISMPQFLLRYLEHRSKTELGEKLWTDTKDFRSFANQFPQFKVCEKI